MANEYGSLAEFKRMRRIPADDHTDDADMLKALERASRAIDRKCSRRFYRDGQVSTRTFSRIGRTVSSFSGDQLLVDDIATDVGLTVGGVGPGEYSVWPNNAAVTGWPITAIARSSWGGSGTVTVTAEWGWPAVPPDIEEATLLLANRRWMRRNSPEGVAGFAQDGPIQVSRFDSDIEDLIQPFVIPGFGA